MTYNYNEGDTKLYLMKPVLQKFGCENPPIAIECTTIAGLIFFQVVRFKKFQSPLGQFIVFNIKNFFLLYRESECQLS